MKDSSFELPKPSEKLSHKFIMDAMKEIERHQGEERTQPKERAEKISLECDPERIPLSLPEEKKYFRIGEVAQFLRVEPYVLRYWETEFSMIKPMKSGSGHRVYVRKDVETLQRIRALLYEDKFSIEGAKKKLKELRAQTTIVQEPARRKHLGTLKHLAKEIRELIHIARGGAGIL